VAVSVVTGDQAGTAAAVAKTAGLDLPVFSPTEVAGFDDAALAVRAKAGAIFARTQPADKLRIVRSLAAAGEVVAVTGDGVNDAPALRAATIGVAMGRGGTDVAREAADLVITDDNFATLVRAMAEGRRLYDNLRKAVRYYLAVKVALITLSLGAALAHLPLPFAPLQIVILELFMDLGASLAFVSQRAEDDVMRRPPRRPDKPFLDRSMVAGILAGGLTLAAITGAAFVVGLSPCATCWPIRPLSAGQPLP
jgi:Ca2+-transporting ATPase